MFDVCFKVNFNSHLLSNEKSGELVTRKNTPGENKRGTLWKVIISTNKVERKKEQNPVLLE